MGIQIGRRAIKRVMIASTLCALVGVGGWFYYSGRTTSPPAVTTVSTTRGPISDVVGTTGTLQAVTTVQVGTQVSGTLQALYADFNSLVKKGQILARLDPSLFQTQIEQASANLIRAQADLDRLKVGLEDARTKLVRALELSGRHLIPQSDLEAAQVNVRLIEAQIRSSEAQVTQARASLNQNEVNLQHTVISAPIDGLVISRNVDVGQTVAASMSAPTLFVLAADLTKMQVVANLDESDVGRIRPGQHVTFRVDAYPSDDFDGTVSQVRLQPIVQQNVVTYATVIDVPNPALRLKPGMTATVSVEINSRADVIRIPNAALRFRPTNEVLARLSPIPAAADQPPDGLVPIQQDRGRGSMGRGFGRGQANAPPVALPASDNPAAMTFDQLFAPAPPVASVGRVWLYQGNQLTPVRVRLGISDGQNTELVEGDLSEGTRVVTNVTTDETRPAATGGFPGLGQPQRGGFPGGFPGGGPPGRGGGP